MLPYPFCINVGMKYNLFAILNEIQARETSKENIVGAKLTTDHFFYIHYTFSIVVHVIK